MEDKIKQYVLMKIQMKDLENACKYLEQEIKDEITVPRKVEGMTLAKRSRMSYKVKE
jgi:hypothetical protein